jgi:hypothetical protein
VLTDDEKYEAAACVRRTLLRLEYLDDPEGAKRSEALLLDAFGLTGYAAPHPVPQVGGAAVSDA